MAAAVWSIEQLNIPPELLLDIVSRLPAESVIQCKCVCRSWHSLLQLNNHHFSKLHLLQQQQQITIRGSNQLDFLTKYNPDGFGVGQEFEYLDYPNHDDVKNQVVEVKDKDGDEDEYAKLSVNYRIRKVDHRLIIDYSPYQKYIFRKGKDYFVQPVGSCNGLVCLGCSGDPVYICNPVTSEHIQIHRHINYHKYRNNHTICRIVSGFGYHPGTCEYKVVRIYYHGSSRDCKGGVEVYTIGKDHGGWREKEQISHALDDYQTGVLVNGTLYWMSRKYNIYGLPSELGIVAFDLAKEEFYEVTVPEVELGYSGPTCIRELGGCLSLIQGAETEDSADVWMMKNCSTGKDNGYSWVKEFSIPWNWYLCDPFTITKNVEILAWYSHEKTQQVFLVRYNPKSGNCKQYAGESNATRTINVWHGTIPHLKSFISLRDLGEEDARRVERHTRVRKVEMSLKRKRRASSCLNFNVFSEDD